MFSTNRLRSGTNGVNHSSGFGGRSETAASVLLRCLFGGCGKDAEKRLGKVLPLRECPIQTEQRCSAGMRREDPLPARGVSLAGRRPVLQLLEQWAQNRAVQNE